MMEMIENLVTWLKVEENFTGQEIDDLKKLTNQIFETLFEIHGKKTYQKFFKKLEGESK